MEGIGVLLARLSDNSESVTAFKGALGKTIAALSLGDDDALHFTFTDGAKMKLFDTGQSCCESRYMRTDDDLQSFVGAVLTGAEIKPAEPLSNEDMGVHDIEFLEVQTDRGVFTMVSHNEHNGYYGGFSIEAAVE